MRFPPRVNERVYLKFSAETFVGSDKSRKFAADLVRGG